MESTRPGVSLLALFTTALGDVTGFFTMPVMAFLPELAKTELVVLALHGCHFGGLVF